MPVHDPTPLICPRCRREAQLARFNVHSVLAMVVMHIRYDQPHVCCAECGRRELVAGQWKTCLGGWWGMFAFFFNIAAIINNCSELSGAAKMPPPGDLPPPLRDAEVQQLAGAVQELAKAPGGLTTQPVGRAFRLAEATGLPPARCMLFALDYQ